MEDLKRVEADIQNCKKCPFNESTDARYCSGFSADYRVMFIAESPSTSGGTGIFKPDANFRSTPADELFYKVKAKFGLENCYTTDLVKCGIPKGKPTKQKINNCLSYLVREIKIVKSKLLVAVGKSIRIEENGRLVKCDFATFLKQKLEITTPIISTWHYSYVRRFKRDEETYANQHKEVLKYL
ncbi:MAG: uracil-DNA glycosylase family protein [Acidobacteriota bacterium]